MNPSLKDYKYTIVESEDNIECIQLLSLIMQSYHALDATKKDAVTIWFYKNYNSRPNEKL